MHMSEEHENVVRSHESGPLVAEEYNRIFFAGWWDLMDLEDWPEKIIEFWTIGRFEAVQDMVSKLSRKE